MAAKKANVIFGDINRNIISKLIGRNSSTQLCPGQTSGLAQCLAKSIRQILVTRMSGRHIFRWTWKLRQQGL